MTIHERYPFSWKVSKCRLPRITQEEVKKRDALKEEIEILNLKTRSFCALKRHAINTVEDLIKNVNNLSNIRGLGIASIVDITEKLRIYLKDCGKENLLKRGA